MNRLDENKVADMPVHLDFSGWRYRIQLEFAVACMWEWKECCCAGGDCCRVQFQAWRANGNEDCKGEQEEDSKGLGEFA